MIIVSSLKQSAEAFAEYRPSHVISILEGDEAVPPAFDTLPADDHLRLIENCSEAANCNNGPGDTRCARLIELAQRWKRGAPILIHCHQGIARSMAAAYIIMCAVEPDRSETEIAERLRQAAPHADPNLLLIAEADALLGREDRMVEAILDLAPSSGTVAAPIVALQVAA